MEEVPGIVFQDHDVIFRREITLILAGVMLVEWSQSIFQFDV